jgi:uroporphyrinogen-III synthase
LAGNTLHMARQSAPGIPVLLTRPRADGESFASALGQRFGTRLRAVLAPLLAPRFIKAHIPAVNYSGVVFTSAHAVEGARRLGVTLPRRAWCVGGKTAAVATASGFQAVSADGDATDLAKLILESPKLGRILYLRGVDTRGKLLETLQEFGIFTDVAIVYAQVEQPLTAEALTLLSASNDVVVPLFSPRTATLFGAALPADLHAKLHIAAMSEAVAAPLSGLSCAQLRVASHPDAASMLDAVESLLTCLPSP